MYITMVEDKTDIIKRKVYRVLAYILLFVISFICLLPFILLLVNATRSNAQLQAGFSLIPRGYMWKNFVNAIHDSSISIGRGLWNSLVVSTFNALLTTYFSVMTAYAIKVYDFKGKKVALGFILAIMMIPTQVSAVGFVQMVDAIGLTNSFLPLIVPSIASPVTFFYMYQYMNNTLEVEIIEAARVDGSSEFRTFNTVALPIMKPAMAVQAIFTFVASWNNYFVPALLISEKNKKTLPIMMANLRSAANSQDYDLGKIYMFVLISILPVILVYLILSKSIIKGASASSPQ